jgi:hypothetical protein
MIELRETLKAAPTTAPPPRPTAVADAEPKSAKRAAKEKKSEAAPSHDDDW